MNKRVLLENEFHNTQWASMARIDEQWGLCLSPAQVARAQAMLCGVEGCCCSGDGGVRGGKWQIDLREDIDGQPALGVLVDRGDR